MGFVGDFNALLPLLKTLISVLRFETVVLPPERVDSTYDTAPLVSSQDYVRLWLAEAQLNPRNGKDGAGAGHLVFSRTQFLYGDRALDIPALIGPALLRSHSTAGSPASRFPINHALTPLFPYRGGPIQLLCGLFRTDRDEIGFTHLIEQLAHLLVSPGFSRRLELSAIVSESIQSRTREYAKPELLFQRTFGLREQSTAAAQDLAPGYIAVIKERASQPQTQTQPIIETLCIVNGSLRTATSPDFRRDHEPLDEGRFEYLLFRIEKQTAREDWGELPDINDLIRLAADAARQGAPDLVRDVFKRIAVEVVRSNDLSQPDARRVIEAVRQQLAQLSLTLSPDGISDLPAAAASANLVPQLESAISADLKNEEKFRQASQEAAASSPFPESHDNQVLAIECNPGSPLRVDISGGLFGSNMGDRILKLDISSHARESDEAFAGNWRAKMKTQGKRLEGELFKDSVWWEAYNLVLKGPDRDLHLRFRCPLDLVRVPFEFLTTKDAREYLVLKHPLSRSVIGEGVPITKRRPLSQSFFNDLYRRGEPLSVLLIASNTPPEIHRVDSEIQALSAKLQDLFHARKIDVRVKTLASDEATIDTVRSEVKRGGHHILHYAGHGVYDESDPEESYLPFWESPRRHGEVQRFKVPALRWALEDTQIRFVYLSCCVGMTQGEAISLQDYDFLGITDGLLQAGIPSILGYRWPIVDSGGEKLSLSFYKHLAQEGEVDTALLLARREVSEDRSDRSWLSPVLVLQA